jgi:asparagine synthase (glutamine-hydrolysing)
MYAFAIWDDRKKELFAARDRLGIKPLYYWHSGDTLILASEIKSILASGLVPVAPDWTSLYTPWHYQISPNTGFKGIQKLEAGHCLKFSMTGLKMKKYWDIEPIEQVISAADAVEQVKELIEDAVRFR